MNQIPEFVESDYLSYLVPINDLTAENMETLAHQTRILSLPKGQSLFKKGDEDDKTFYILEGEIDLVDDGQTRTIAGLTRQARFPLDHNRPRMATAVARTDIHYIAIDNNLLDILLTWDQNTSLVVTEIETNNSDVTAEDTDWMTHMLRTEIFHRIPPGNIQSVFMRMEAISCKKGDRIITQGDEGDYFYYIKKGRCLVSHNSKSGKEIKLAELSTGSTFGEEALVSEDRRNANVSMLTEGVLMRLAKDSFQELLRAPVIQTITLGEAEQLLNDGAVWLDVRLENEYKHTHLPESLNVPLYKLRFMADTLDKGKKYITYCDTGSRSSSAAYLLSERGFDAYLLKGGLLGQRVPQ